MPPLEGVRAKIFNDRYALKNSEGEQVEQKPEEMWRRVATAMAQVELPSQIDTWSQKFYDALSDFKFVPAGRILHGAGTGHAVTYYNCFVQPSPEDSVEGIFDSLKEWASIMRRGGGVGINLSSLRPRGSYIKTVNGYSSGPVTWAELYSVTTGRVIQQGGCFAADQRIVTDAGLITAEELANRLDQGEMISALTHEGPRRITYAFRNGVKPVFRVILASGVTSVITSDHKVGILVDGEITTVPLSSLENGDDVLVYLGDFAGGAYQMLTSVSYTRSKMSTTLNENITLPEILDEDLAYLLGYSHGNGYIHTGRKINWEAPKALKLSTPNTNPALQDRLASLAKSLFGLQVAREDASRHGSDCTNISLHSRLLMEWLDQNGLLKGRAEDIRVPEVIFRSPSSVISSFITGYFDADGSDRGKSGYGFDSISLGMLQDVQQLLLAHGIMCRITATDRSDKGWSTIYRLTVTGTAFKQRMCALLDSSLKVKELSFHQGDYCNLYPREVVDSLRIPVEHRSGLWDGISPRISYNALERILGRLQVSPGQAMCAHRVEQLLTVLPDPIVDISLVGDQETFDFEVEHAHMLSGNGLYTSNSRRGAAMIMLNDDHPDIMEFIQSKSIDPITGRPVAIEHANISPCISDAFMQAVKDDGVWQTQWPTKAEIAANPGMEVKTWGPQYRARDIWRAICESAWRTAEPGLCFMERAQRELNTGYCETLVSTNPCFTGDTLIATTTGLRRADELARSGEAIYPILDSRFGGGPVGVSVRGVFSSGIKDVYRLETKEGYSVRVTADHKIRTVRGWIPAQELRSGDKIHLQDHKGGFGTQGSYDLGLALGWMAGDGTLKPTQAVLSFFGAKRELTSQFVEVIDRLVQSVATEHTHRGTDSYTVSPVSLDGRDEDRISSVRLRRLLAEYGMTDERATTPDSVLCGTEEMQRGFLQALFSADGTVLYSKSKGARSVRLSSTSMDLLKKVQMLLINFGIRSVIHTDRRQAGWQSMPDGHGGQKDYYCAACHELIIGSGIHIRHFADEIGFLQTYQQAKLADLVASYQETYRAPYVASFTALVPDGCEEVFDLTEEVTHSLVANSIVISNCGEQALSPYAVCNLGAVNLAAFVSGPIGEAVFDFPALAETVATATRFLDNVIDTSEYFYEENRAVQQNGVRRMGLGTMGLADALIHLGIRYGSPESIEFIHNVYAIIRDTAYATSAKIAYEKGSFGWYEQEPFLAAPFVSRLPEAIRLMIKACGIRNGVLLTAAPTGTTSLVAGVSSGIEPVFAFSMRRVDRTGESIIHHPLVDRWYAENPGVPLPGYFVSTPDLSPEDHIAVQATIQYYNDSSISKTTNGPNTHTIEDVERLYMLAYDTGCKGITYYRDGSRDAVLHHIDPKETSRDTSSVDSHPSNHQSRLEHVDSNHLPRDPNPPADSFTPDAVEYTTVLDEPTVPRPRVLAGLTYQVKAPEGTVHVTLNSDDHGPREVFINIGRAGSDINAMAEALGRLVSLSLRGGVSLHDVMRQLRGIGGARTVGFGPNQIRSLPDAVAMALDQHLSSIPTMDESLRVQDSDSPLIVYPKIDHLPTTRTATPVTAPLQVMGGHGLLATSSNGASSRSNGASYSSQTGNYCPDCGSMTLIREEGCSKCYSCGYSAC